MKSPEKLLARLEWTVLRRLDGQLQGDYRTVFRGAGIDFSELREYEITDDVRYIDWNVTARMNTPYVRQYTEDREVTAWFLLDVSPSVDFGTEARVKRDVLIDFVGVLARIFTRRGNRVGAVFYSGDLDGVIPPGGGRLQVLSLLRALLAQPRRIQAPPTALGVLLDDALRLIRRRSLVFVLSDFISAPGWQRPLKALAMRHEVLAVRLHDPSETELPDLGLVVMQDAESGEQMMVDTHDPGFRQRFVEAAARREAGLRAALASSGVDVLDLSTRDDLAKRLVDYAGMRKRRKALPRTPVRPTVQADGSPMRAGSR